MGEQMLSRVAVVYDDSCRPETTGLYVRRALVKLVNHVEHFQPSDLAGLMINGFDAYIFVDDGLNYPLPEMSVPSAWWAIDTHINYEESFNKAQAAVCIFAAQRDGALRFQAEGLTGAKWLPLACDPFFHGRRMVDCCRDLCFIGNLFPGPRMDLIKRLRQKWPDMFVGQRYFEQMAHTYSESRIAFNRVSARRTAGSASAAPVPLFAGFLLA